MVRIAKIDEGKRALKLISFAYAKAFFKLGPGESVDEVIDFLLPLYQEKGNRISHENILVYEADGVLKGAICIYDAQNSSKLDAKINALLAKPLEKEGLEEFYYIDALAVDEAYRRQGVAKDLIQAACLEAKKASKDISLLVDQANKIALRSYEKLGFKYYSHLFFNNAPYFRMVKPLTSASKN